MEQKEFLELYDGKISNLRYWYCFWFMDYSFENLNNLVTKCYERGDVEKTENICVVIAMKQLVKKLNKQ